MGKLEQDYYELLIMWLNLMKAYLELFNEIVDNEEVSRELLKSLQRFLVPYKALATIAVKEAEIFHP